MITPQVRRFLAFETYILTCRQSLITMQAKWETARTSGSGSLFGNMQLQSKLTDMIKGLRVMEFLCQNFVLTPSLFQFYANIFHISNFMFYYKVILWPGRDRYCTHTV